MVKGSGTTTPGSDRKQAASNVLVKLISVALCELKLPASRSASLSWVGTKNSEPAAASATVSASTR
jgi:hypothetical protein